MTSSKGKMMKNESRLSPLAIFYSHGRTGIILILALAGGLFCRPVVPTADAEREFPEILEWREERLQSLQRDDGWLTLAGLFWLQEGENSFGSDPENDLIFPAGKVPGFAGTFHVGAEGTVIEVFDGVPITSEQQPVSSLKLRSDADGDPTMLETGSLTFYLIERDGQPAIRLKDRESAILKEFQGLEYFPIDPRWRVQANFKRLESSVSINVPTAQGTTTQLELAGALIFRIGEKTYRLDAIGEPDAEQLFIIFGDVTNGKETYSGGRFLTIPQPDAEGSAVIDFNLAYNPPCVFTPYATCPLPPQQNRLPIRIEAGEKVYGDHH